VRQYMHPRKNKPRTTSSRPLPLDHLRPQFALVAPSNRARQAHVQRQVPPLRYLWETSDLAFAEQVDQDDRFLHLQILTMAQSCERTWQDGGRGGPEMKLRQLSQTRHVLAVLPDLMLVEQAMFANFHQCLNSDEKRRRHKKKRLRLSCAVMIAEDVFE
jgi:hypothetical protein